MLPMVPLNSAIMAIINDIHRDLPIAHAQLNRNALCSYYVAILLVVCILNVVLVSKHAELASCWWRVLWWDNNGNNGNVHLPASL